MSPALYTSTFCLLAYLVGSIPFALILGLLRGVDIRTIGSGNIGATNLTRAFGTRWGVAAFFLDFLKGLAPVLAAKAAQVSEPSFLALGQDGWAFVLVGTSAILGHVFPLWLGFRGGKGVATTFGAMLGLSWLSTLAMAAVWLLTFACTRTVSIASLGAAVALPVAAWIVHHGSGAGCRASIPAFAVVVAALIILRHHSNIRRLIRGKDLAPGKQETGPGPKKCGSHEEGGSHAAL